MPGPPALVMISTRSPRGSGCIDSAVAKSRICSKTSARMTPERWKAAPKAISVPASTPVCEEAARWPACVVPAFIRTTGFFDAASSAASMKASPVAMLSR